MSSQYLATAGQDDFIPIF